MAEKIEKNEYVNDDTNGDLLKPIDAYKNIYKEKVNQTANEDFEKLKDKSGIDVDANRTTIKELKNLFAERNKLAKKSSSKSTLKTFFIILGVILILAGVLLVLLGVYETINLALGIVLGILCVGIAVVLFVYAGKKVSKSIKALDAQISELDNKIKAKESEAKKQMAPLIALFDWNMAAQIVSDALPLIIMDKYFDGGKQKSLIMDYGLDENMDPDYSSLYVQSGSILGNPFLIQKAKVHKVINKVYTGQRVVTYTVRVHDEKGHSHTTTTTQVLTATVTHPAPEYHNETVLLYGNAAAPDLIFSRGPQNMSGKSDKAIKKFVNSAQKDLTKMSEDATKKGQHFQPLANTEFEALFHAWNRNNEQQFRLLFTPLAQQNEVQATTCTDGFGDDFYFYKQKMMNAISSAHSQSFDYSGDPAQFVDISYDECKKKFVNHVNDFFKNFYFDLVPLISIPLYQQMKSIDYIYGDDSPSNYANYEHEVMANSFEPKNFAHPETNTDVMLKTKTLQKDGLSDKVQVTAYSYKGEPRIDHVMVVAGNGKPYSVPVPWTEYFKREQETVMEMRKTDTTRNEFNSYLKNTSLASFIAKNSKGGLYSYQKGFIALLIDAGKYNSKSDSELGSFFTKKESEDE